MPEEKIIPVEAEPGMTIRVIEEQHTTCVRQAAPPEEVAVCCQEFAEDYGKAFRLLPGGGLVPDAVRLYRVKLGKEQYDRPKIAWKFCPLCGRPIATAVEVFTKTTASEQ